MSEELYHVQIDSSTIDGNVEFVYSQYSCILTSKVSPSFLCPAKLLKIVIILEWSAYLTVKYVQLYVLFIFCFYLHFFIYSWKTCQLMWEIFIFLVIFDTCDVVYNGSISLLPPVVLDNLFDYIIYYLFSTA